MITFPKSFSTNRSCSIRDKMKVFSFILFFSICRIASGYALSTTSYLSYHLAMLAVLYIVPPHSPLYHSFSCISLSRFLSVYPVRAKLSKEPFFAMCPRNSNCFFLVLHLILLFSPFSLKLLLNTPSILFSAFCKLISVLPEVFSSSGWKFSTIHCCIPYGWPLVSEDACLLGL